MTETARLIKETRLEKGISQALLAKKIGVSSAFIRKVESGVSPWPKARIGQLSRALGLRREIILDVIVVDFGGRLK